MSPITRSRLEKTIEYHEGVSNFYKGLAGLKEDEPLPEDDEAANGNGDSDAQAMPESPPMPPTERVYVNNPPIQPNENGTNGTGNGQGNATDEEKAKAKQRKDDLTLAKTHAEVARQLRAVINREPVESKIMQAQREQQVMRDPQFGLRPQAGRFH